MVGDVSGVKIAPRHRAHRNSASVCGLPGSRIPRRARAPKEFRLLLPCVHAYKLSGQLQAALLDLVQCRYDGINVQVFPVTLALMFGKNPRMPGIREMQGPKVSPIPRVDHPTCLDSEREEFDIRTGNHPGFGYGNYVMSRVPKVLDKNLALAILVDEQPHP